MNREENLSIINEDRAEAENEALQERGPDLIVSAPNPGVIVLPVDEPAVFPLGLSGSLTKLANGDDYLVAGSNITLVTSSNGAVIISADLVSEAPPAAGGNYEIQYNDGSSSLTGSAGFTYDNSTETLRVTNISGSLTKLSDGSDYLRAGGGVIVSNESNGSITIGSNHPGTSTWLTYVPTIGATISPPTIPSSCNLQGKYVVQGKMMTLLFSFSGNSSTGAAAGSGTYTISIPTGYNINTSLITLGSAPSYLTGTPLAVASLTADIVGAGGAWAVVPNSSTSLVLVGQNPASTSQPLTWGSDNFYIGQSSEYRVSFIATIPIV